MKSLQILTDALYKYSLNHSEFVFVLCYNNCCFFTATNKNLRKHFGPSCILRSIFIYSIVEKKGRNLTISDVNCDVFTCKC